jgi:release factor glutamine methyltransferase
LLRTGGVFAVEHDDTNQDGVLTLLAADGRWSEISPHRDLSGRPRCVVAVRA